MKNGDILRYFFEDETEIDDIVEALATSNFCPKNDEYECGMCTKHDLDCRKCYKSLLERDDGLKLDIDIN